MQYPAFNGAQYIDIKKMIKSLSSTGNISHGDLMNLLVDDHTQYWIGDGSRASDYLQFNTSLTPTTSVEGRVHWDDDSGTMEVDLPGGNVKLQVGQEGLVRVRNESGSDISNGLMVYTTGSSGNKPTVAHADNTDADKIHLLGMATEDIVHNANGYVALWGNVSGDMTQPINTLAYAEGTKLYLDTSGTWTDTHPPLPSNAVVIIGEVTRQHASEGKIMLLPRYFTLGNNYNGTLRQSIINKSTGNAAGASFTVVNDQGYRASLSIFGNSHAALSNVAGLYNSGYGDTAYVTDGNKDHVWYTDPSDLHNFNSLNFERMRLEADGTLTVGTPNYEDLVTADNDIPNKKFADENYVGRDLVNGTFQESFNCLAEGFGTSRLIAYLEKSGGGDLTMQFSDGNFPLDCTPSNSVVLTSGTPTVPQTNYVYVLQSTKALTVSTSDWPATEHIKVSFFLVLDPAYADGALINQNWNDHLMGTDNMGHLAHMAERSRRLGAIWHSGVTGAGGDDYTTSAAGTVYYKSNSGVLYQMHKHNYGAKDTDPAGANDNLHIVNHDTTPYYEVHNLYDATNDAAGGTLTNKYFNVVFWGVANKGGQYSPIMMNLPTGSYNNIDDAEGDVDGYDVYTIPHSFAQDSSTGFLIARHTFRKTGGTWAYQSGVDLRGTTPSTVTGGASGATQTEFSDNQFAIFDGADNTRIINFVADNITTSNTRLITMADWDVDLADISNIAADVSNNYATNVEVSNLGIASAAAYALKTDVSNNYETIVNVTALRTDVSNNYGTQVDVDSRALKTDVSNNYETIVNVTALRTDVSNNYLDLYGSQAMRGDLDLGGFKLSNVDDINTNLIWATGNVTVEMQHISSARTFYIKNTLGAAAHLSVQNNILVGGTVDGVDLSGLKGDYDNLQTDVSNHFWRDTSNHVLEVNVGTRALKTDVSNHYALKTDVSNNYGTQVDVDSRALKTDVSNNYAALGASVNFLDIDINGQYSIIEDSQGQVKFVNGGDQYINIDLGEDWEWGATFSLGGTSMSTFRFDDNVAIGNDTYLLLGSYSTFGFRFDKSGGVPYYVPRIETAIDGSTTSGYLFFNEYLQDRVPTDQVSNPTFRIYAAGLASANDYIQFYHDTDHGYIDVGDGDLKVNTNLDVSNDLTVSGEMNGSRMMLGFGGYTMTSDAWLKATGYQTTGSGKGCVMARSGSIISLAYHYDWNVHTTNGNSRFHVTVEGSDAYSSTDAHTGAAWEITGYQTQARGVTTFNAGDQIACRFEFDTAVGASRNHIVNVEIVFDD